MAHAELEAEEPNLKAAAHAFQPPLLPLPERPTRKLPPASDEERAVLDRLLAQLSSPDRASRLVAAEEVHNVDESLLPAIVERIDREATNANRVAMKAYLLDVRRSARDKLKAQMVAAGRQGEVETPDYLQMLVQYGSPEAKPYDSLVRVLALSRMCVSLASTPAVRLLLRVYVRFAFLRIDTQLQLKALGDKALPALIELTRHPAPQVASWARRQLDFFGKAIPSETVGVADPHALADILRAYGYTKNPDAGRLIASFANSENSEIRTAARQAIVLQGEHILWQLRDTYEDTVGSKPAREWGWERTAQELFREYDRLRLAEVYEAFEAGVLALRQDDLAEARLRFNQVLSRAPTFANRAPIVDGYLRYAEKYHDKHPEETVDALSRAERLTSDDAIRRRARSLRLTIRAQQRLEQTQVADRALLTEALELDPSNGRAQDLLSAMSRDADARDRTWWHRRAPLWLLILGAAAAFVVILRGALRSSSDRQNLA